MKNKKWNGDGMFFRIIILCIAFISGFAIMGYEILGARILQPWCGSSIHVWGATISVFLGGISIGSAIGGKIADKHATPNALVILILIPALLGIFFPLYGKAICKFVFSMDLKASFTSIFLATFLFLMPCVFIGSLLPILAKMLAERNEGAKIGSAIGSVWAISNFGCICGTLFSAFFLIGLIGASTGIALMGIILALCLPLCLLVNRKNL